MPAMTMPYKVKSAKGRITHAATGHGQRRPARQRPTTSSGRKTIPKPKGKVFQYWKKKWMTGGELPLTTLIDELVLRLLQRDTKSRIAAKAVHSIVEVEASTALDDCSKGNTAAAIPTPNNSLFGQSVARASWVLTIPGASLKW